ncbi:MAG: hypothetical protein K2G03_05590, partial [Bacilli bacterium]|nr:hypothetical protein [Bacilli bacterium]
EYIRGESYIWYWERFLVLMLLTIIFKIPNDVTLLCIIGNFGLKLFDMYILLPKLWIKKQLKKVYETKEEQEQRELYEEVSKARSLYHKLNKKYEQEFMKLSREEEQEYLSFLEDLGISWDLEESSNNNLVEVSSDVKMLEKVMRETREFI